jgi:hypothetical protein
MKKTVEEKVTVYEHYERRADGLYQNGRKVASLFTPMPDVPEGYWGVDEWGTVNIRS